MAAMQQRVIEKGDTSPRATIFVHDAEGCRLTLTLTGDESPTSCTVDAIECKVDQFRVARREEARRKFRQVVVLSATNLVLGALSHLLGLVVEYLHVAAGTLIRGFAAFGIAVGIVMVSTIPMKDIDIDEIMHKRVWLRRICATIFALVHCYYGATVKPHAHAVVVIPCALAFWTGDFFVQCIWLGFALNTAGWIVQDLATVNFQDSLDSVFWSMLIRIGAVCMLLALPVWVLTRRRPHPVCRSMLCTELLYQAVYVTLTTAGFAHVVRSLLGAWSGRYELTIGIFKMVQGAGYVLPVVVLWVVGPERLFNQAARRFNANLERAQRDGAFVAALLDDAHGVAVGEAWWVHREEDCKDMRHAEGDLHRHWVQGRVIEIDQCDFVVDLGQTVGWKGDHRRMPLSSRGTPWQELLAQARHQLVCVDACLMRKDVLMDRTVMEEDRALPRSLRPSEKIDFFLSHSWHDDGNLKWQALSNVCLSFQQRHSRPPTIWIDKLCIDQANIADGLRVLPVYVMAARRLLALWGATYASRLWCVWELFILTAFIATEDANERLKVVTLCEDYRAPSTHLQQFSLSRATCYDPNEETQLRRVICAMGADQFTDSIRALSLQFRADRPTYVGAWDSITSNSLSVFSSVPSRTRTISSGLRRAIQRGMQLQGWRAPEGNGADLQSPSDGSASPVSTWAGSMEGAPSLKGTPSVGTRALLLAASLEAGDAAADLNETQTMTDAGRPERILGLWAESLDVCMLWDGRMIIEL